MSLFGTLNTSVAGMSAQANMLGTIGDNIANSSTTGYKDASTEFQTLLGVQTTGSYQSGGVTTQVRYNVTGQGNIESGYTNVSDLAISGQGFFVVQNPQGNGVAMTRAGAFVPDSQGNLVNTAGYTLMGYSLTDGTTPAANGTADLVPIKLTGANLSATPSTTGTFTVNLPSTTSPPTTTTTSGTPAVTTTTPADTPADNKADSQYTNKDSLVAYDNLGNKVTLDVYMTNVSTSSSNPQWQVAIYNQADAASSGGFPYSSGPLSSETLTFSTDNGSLVSSTNNLTGTADTTAGDLTFTVPGGKSMTLDMSNSTQLAADYSASEATVNGNAPSQFDHFAISTDGTVSEVFTDGASEATYRIPLATVESPDNLTAVSGNVYTSNTESGDMAIGIPLTGKLGEIQSNSLEDSTVDIATELTSMIAAQRSYQANSQVLQTSSDLLSVLNNIHS